MKISKKYLFAGLAALALAFLIAGNVHAGSNGCCYKDSRNNQFCVAVEHIISQNGVLLKCHADGSFKRVCINGCYNEKYDYCFSVGSWYVDSVKKICRADGTWYTVQAQSYKCTVGSKTYEPRSTPYEFSNGLFICKSNGKWDYVESQSNCYLAGKTYNPGDTFTFYGTYYICKTGGKREIYSWSCYSGRFTCKKVNGVLYATNSQGTWEYEYATNGPWEKVGSLRASIISFW